MGVSEEELLDAGEVLRTAVQRRDGLEARIRKGELDRDLLDRSLQAAETVLAARARWHRLMRQAGWTPPHHLAQDLARDEELLDLHT